MTAPSLNIIVRVADKSIANNLPLALIAGPCQIESMQMAMETAAYLAELCAQMNVPFIFKSSFDKANRTSINGRRGMGLEAAIEVFSKIKKEVGCPILTDVHNEEQCRALAGVVDVLQIPALLSRQTDLLVEAGKTGMAVNIKKGQFMAPWDIKNAAAKVSSTGNSNIMLTERGVSFGYNRLVNDMRALQIMAETGYPVVFDATHSVQEPSAEGMQSGGQRQYVPALARAAVAVGIAALFIETHPDPDSAHSDGPCMMHLDDMPTLLKSVCSIDNLVKQI